MITLVNGLHPQGNMQEVCRLGIDWAGLSFDADSPDFVPLHASRSGIVPDRATFQSSRIASAPHSPHAVAMAGFFTDTMPQTLITNVVVHQLSVVVFHGDEGTVWLDNLRRTLVPDITPQLTFVKTIRLHSPADLAKAQPYIGHTDYFLFELCEPLLEDCKPSQDASWLQDYHADVPFIVDGHFDDRHLPPTALLQHPQCAGIALYAGNATHRPSLTPPQISTILHTLQG